MCLIVNSTDAIVASDDIICYKVLRFHQTETKYHVRYGRKDTPHHRVLLSPYRGYRYFNDGNMKPYPKVSLGVVHKLPYKSQAVLKYNRGAYKVEEGLHTYIHARHATRMAEDFSGECRDHFVFVCIIPKGTRYFEGAFQGEPSYASDQLIVLPLDDPRAFKYDGLEL
jgi:hypothetical protein